MTCSIIYLLPSTLIACSAYRLMVSIVAFLSNEDKKSSSEDMGERCPIGGGVFRAAFSRIARMRYHTFHGNVIPVTPSDGDRLDGCRDDLNAIGDVPRLIACRPTSVR
jgi:hypothetical protein